MWNSTIKLPIYIDSSKDKDGFKNDTPVYIESVPCEVLSTTRNDEILANASGYTADIVIELMKCNYAGQREIVEESSGDSYVVKRTFSKKGSNRIQLTCQRR